MANLIVMMARMRIIVVSFPSSSSISFFLILILIIIAKRCEYNHFECFDGRCIPYESVCNVKLDCAGGEDEINCGRTCNQTNICSYGCVDLPMGSIKCTCPAHMHLAADEITCMSLDPCLEWGTCSQLCSSLDKTKYLCSCFDNFELSQVDERTCVSKSKKKLKKKIPNSNND